MTVAVAFVAGFAAAVVWHRLALRVFCHYLLEGGNKTERMRKALFTKSTYDTLLTIRDALEAEIARRRP